MNNQIPEISPDEKRTMEIRSMIHWRLRWSIGCNLGLMHQYLSKFNPECMINHDEFKTHLNRE
jgi:hypothetical protein